MCRILTLTAVTLMVACGPGPVVRNLARDPLPAAVPALPDRGCTIAVLPVHDVRPPDEQAGEAPRTIKVLVPVPLVFVKSTEGLQAARPKNLGGEHLLTDLQLGVGAMIAKSQLCRVVDDPRQATHTLGVTLEHLYAVNAYRSLFWATYGAASSSKTDFYPAGHAELVFTLTPVDGAEATTFRLSGSQLFEPGAAGSDASFSPQGVQGAQVENNRTQQIVAALAEVYRRLPAAIDRALAAGATGGAVDASTFDIVRQLDDLDHVELATIDGATGAVLDSRVVLRAFPIISAPGEWVVSPYQPATLSAVAYARLLDRLSARFVIDRDDNLSAAVFHGLRPRALAPAVAAASRSAPSIASLEAAPRRARTKVSAGTRAPRRSRSGSGGRAPR